MLSPVRRIPSAPSGPAARDARLELAIFAGDAVAVHPLPAAGSVTIGRTEGNDLRIDNPSVSRKHAVLHVGPPLAIEDLGGANGTQIRDPRQEVVDGQTQQLRRVV